ncbi:MAG: glycosyltransferase family 2 protein [Planctomycetota bacterium]
MQNTISCIIRTYNEAKYIGRVIETIRSQEKFGNAVEIVVIDSGSTDATLKIARKHIVKIIEIPKVEFNYSRSLNLGIENSVGDLIVILSAHSVPCSNDWLKTMVACLEDKTVAGVYCRQIPWPEADLPEVLMIERMFGENRRVFCEKTPENNVSFSNAGSCIRRSVWNEHHFANLPAAEDLEWVQWAIAHGYKIVYEPGAIVWHSHKESCREVAQRVIALVKSADIRSGRKHSFFLTARRSAGWIFRSIKLILSDKRFVGSRPAYCLRSILYGFWFIIDFYAKRD